VRAERIKLVHGEGSRGIGAQEGGNLGGLHLVHAEGVGPQRGVGGFKLRLYLIPGQGKTLLRGTETRRKQEQHGRHGNRQEREDSLHTQPLRRGLYGGHRRREAKRCRKSAAKDQAAGGGRF
jgi:hypothetical protein